LISTTTETDSHFILLIDHQQAQIFKTERKGTVPEKVTHLHSDGSSSHVHSAHDYKDHNGQPDYYVYFEHVVKSLAGADKILIFGSGTGSSSAMDLFVAWLGKRRKPIAARVVGTVIVDKSHLTEAELLAKAREFYSKLA
jgi:hypothetical protein